MKILIVYASKTGTTKECAEFLASELSTHDVFIANAAENVPALDGFDTVVVGSPIRMGGVHKSIRRFLSDRRTELEGVRRGYFVCCAYADRVDEYFSSMLKKKERESAIFLANFGGELKVERQKNFIMKQVCNF